ncbi:MAG: hypothetical protein WC979_07750 [Candidatus Pacearchaeota archaeon]|jgi:hypothetical protein
MTEKIKASSNLDDLKKAYEVLKQKYDLPEFYDLNKFFDIEEIEVESDFLLRKIRRITAERISSYSRFADFVLNPSNAPMFFFKVLKKLDDKDKEMLGNVYELLGKIEIEVISLDLDYSELKEADFIKKVFKLFDEEIRIKFLGVMDKLSNGEKQQKKEGNVSYFG